MSGTAAPLVLGWGSAAVAAAYLALFLGARRPVSLRLGRLGWAAMGLAAARVGLIAAGSPLQGGADALGLSALLLGGIALRSGARIWLVRATAEGLRGQIRSTCRGLFLECGEPGPGRFRLTGSGRVDELRVREIGKRTQVVILPRTAGRNKAALLVCWLSKQYPGPLPRIHRDLTRSKTS